VRSPRRPGKWLRGGSAGRTERGRASGKQAEPDDEEEGDDDHHRRCNRGRLWGSWLYSQESEEGEDGLAEEPVEKVGDINRCALGLPLFHPREGRHGFYHIAQDEARKPGHESQDHPRKYEDYNQKNSQ